MFNSAVYERLREALGGKLTSEEQFAIIALINEPAFQPADLEEDSICKCHSCLVHVVYLFLFVSTCLKHVILDIYAFLIELSIKT